MKNLAQKLKIGIISAALTFGAVNSSSVQDFSAYKSVHLVKQESSSIGSLEIYDALDKENHHTTIDVLREGNTMVQYTGNEAGEFMDITQPGIKISIFEAGCFDYTYTQVIVNNISYDDPKNPKDNKVIHEAELLYDKYIQDINNISKISKPIDDMAYLVSKSERLIYDDSCSGIGSLKVYRCLKKENEEPISVFVLKEGNTVVEYSKDECGKYMYIKGGLETINIYELNEMYGIPPSTIVCINGGCYYSGNPEYKKNSEYKEIIQKEELLFDKYFQDMKKIQFDDICLSKIHRKQ